MCLELQREACGCPGRDATLEPLERELPDDVSTTGAFRQVKLRERVLWEMVSNVGSGVTESRKEQLFLMFSNHSDVFCLHLNDTRHNTEVKRHIDTGGWPLEITTSFSFIRLHIE